MRISVGQKTPLGRLALRVISEIFCGPNYDLSDLKVSISRGVSPECSPPIIISFYDMERTIGPKHTNYSELNSKLDNTVESARVP